MPSAAKKSLSRNKHRRDLKSSFQETKANQWIRIAESTEQVKNTKYELEYIKIVDLFQDGFG